MDSAELHALREELVTVAGLLYQEVAPGEYSKPMLPFLVHALGRMMVRINAVHAPLRKAVGAHSVSPDDFDRSGPRAALLEALLADSKVRTKLTEKRAKDVPAPVSDELVNELGNLRVQLAKARDALTAINVRATAALGDTLPPTQVSLKSRNRRPRAEPDGIESEYVKAPPRSGSSDGRQRMLLTLAEFSPIGLTRYQLGFLARVASSSGTFSNYFGEIRPQLIDLPGKRYTVNPATAAKFAGPDRALKTQKGRSDRFKQRLEAGARRMLDVLEAAPAAGMDRTVLGERARVASSSGTFSNYLGRLVNCELVVAERGRPVRLSSWLTTGNG